jgi:Skp family chaperone for outer membrane proteins
MNLAPKTLWSAVVAVGLAGVMLAAAGRAQTPPAAGPAVAPAASNPPPTKLAVVNIVDLFENLKEKAAADADIDKMKKDYEGESLKKQTQLDLARDNLDKTYKKGTPEYRKAQDDLLRMATEKQVNDQVNQQKLFMELRLRTIDLYNKINEAVADYAQANGIALVFVADNSSVEGARTVEQLQAMVTVRKILYAHPSFEITKAILNKMNTEYELGLRNKPAATRP